MSGCERGLGCHPERSEGSGWPHARILCCAQDDKSHLQISNQEVGHVLIQPRDEVEESQEFFLDLWHGTLKAMGNLLLSYSDEVV